MNSDLREGQHYLSRSRGQHNKPTRGYVNNVLKLTQDEAEFQNSVGSERFVERQLSPNMLQSPNERSMAKYVLMKTMEDSS